MTSCPPPLPHPGSCVCSLPARYSFTIIPPLGKLVTGDAQPYQYDLRTAAARECKWALRACHVTRGCRYLVESIRKFHDQEALEQLMRLAGFKAVSHKNFTCGVVAVHSGFKL